MSNARESCHVPKLSWSGFYNKNADYSMNFVVNLFTTSVSLLNQELLKSEIQTSELAKMPHVFFIWLILKASATLKSIWSLSLFIKTKLTIVT